MTQSESQKNHVAKIDQLTSDEDNGVVRIIHVGWVKFAQVLGGYSQTSNSAILAVRKMESDSRMKPHHELRLFYPPYIF